MSVLQITDQALFEQLCSENADKLLLMDFYATWCGPCKQIMPELPQIASDYPTIIIVKVDVDEADQLAEQFQVTAMPTFILMRNSEKLEEYTGTDIVHIRGLVEKHAN